MVGVDNLDPYYDTNLKVDRLAEVGRHRNFRLVRGDLTDRDLMGRMFTEHRFAYAV